MTTRIERLTFADYRADPSYGSSDIKAMRHGPPAMVPWLRENERPETDATRLGTAAHLAILSPNEYLSAYAHKPEGMSFATKEGKEWRAAQEGRDILTFDEASLVGAIIAAFNAKSAARYSLDYNRAELSVFWTCAESGLASKAKPDWFNDEHVYDLKVSRHAEREQWLAFRAYSEGWMHQLAHYRAGLVAAGVPVVGGRLVVISPKPPHHVRLVEIKPDTLDLLELENVATRRRIAECEQNGVFPGTADTFTVIEPPASALLASVDMNLDTTGTEEADG